MFKIEIPDIQEQNTDPKRMTVSFIYCLLFCLIVDIINYGYCGEGDIFLA